MTDWNSDPFSSSESDPEFGLLPTPRMRRLLASWLGLGLDRPSVLEKVRAAGLRQRISLARRELRALHVREQVRLLTQAARIRAHSSSESECRRRACAVWPEPLLPLEEWRSLCREELVCGRAPGLRAPKTLKRLFERAVDDWPSASDLMRIALHLCREGTVQLDLLCATFVEQPRADLRAELGDLWSQGRLSDEARQDLLRTLAVCHEVEGDAQRAAACWDLVLGRSPDSRAAHVARFALLLSNADERGAREAAASLKELVARSDPARAQLARAFCERAWISRVARRAPNPEARALRLELLATGDPMLTELCLELS